MSHDLTSSLANLQSSIAESLLVRESDGVYRHAEPAEVLRAAQRFLANQVRGTEIMSSPAVVKDFLRVRLAALPHEVFAVVHLDAQNRVIDYAEMFRGTVTQTSVYPGEVVRRRCSATAPPCCWCTTIRPGRRTRLVRTRR